MEMDPRKASSFENSENGHDSLQKHSAILARSRWFRTMRELLSSGVPVGEVIGVCGSVVPRVLSMLTSHRSRKAAAIVRFDYRKGSTCGLWWQRPAENFVPAVQQSLTQIGTYESGAWWPERGRLLNI